MGPPPERSELIAALVIVAVVLAASLAVLLTTRTPPASPAAQTAPLHDTLADRVKPATDGQDQPPAGSSQAAPPPRLVIRKALYGDLPNGPGLDVTDKVAAMVRDDSLTVDAANDNFTDPAAGVTKKLRVDFTFGGQDKSKTVTEGQTLTIASRDIKDAKLVIRKAVYGDLPNGGQIEVTDKIATMIKDDALSVDATNDNFTDPASGIVKTLRVDYTFDGKEKSKTASENDTLTISSAGE